MGRRHWLAALAGAGGLALLGQLAVPAPGFASATVGCQVSATAAFSPTGPGLGGPFDWTMDGSLTGCTAQPGASTATTAKVSVGEGLTVSVPITVSHNKVVQGTAEYQEPIGTGQAEQGIYACASSNLFGINAYFQWSDGTITETTLSLVSVGGVAQFQGTVGTGAVLNLIPGTENPPGTAPSTYVVNSDNPNMDQAEEYSGVAALTTNDPVDCTTTQGLQSVNAIGAVQFGENFNLPRI